MLLNNVLNNVINQSIATMDLQTSTIWVLNCGIRNWIVRNDKTRLVSKSYLNRYLILPMYVMPLFSY